MVVEVRIPGPLQRLAHGSKIVLAEGETVGQLIDYLESRYPGFRDRMVGEGGDLHGFVNVYVNGEDVRLLRGLDTPLEKGDVVSILPAMAGGGVDALPGKPPFDRRRSLEREGTKRTPYVRCAYERRDCGC